MQRFACALLLTALLPMPGNAMEVVTFEQLRTKDRQMTDIYVGAAGEGVQMANALLVANQQTPLYCAPVKLVMTDAIYARIALDETERLRKEGTFDSQYTIAQVLVLGLIQTFPCEVKGG